MYRLLNLDKVIETNQILLHRISERFPESGLRQVCAELLKICEETTKRAAWIGQPNKLLRWSIYFIVFISIVVLVYSFSILSISNQTFKWGEFLQVLEAGINNMVFIGAALFFLFTIETRIKRKRTLTALHELRAIAHIIDMHQLTKDPMFATGATQQTTSSPKRELTTFELGRYLDYCSEMLAIVGKVAALYAQEFHDSVVIASVNDVENLTSDMSRKVWQKIMILQNTNEVDLDD